MKEVKHLSDMEEIHTLVVRQDCHVITESHNRHIWKEPFLLNDIACQRIQCIVFSIV